VLSSANLGIIRLGQRDTADACPLCSVPVADGLDVHDRAVHASVKSCLARAIVPADGASGAHFGTERDGAPDRPMGGKFRS
jgi:hypothetical protein